jgi:hypothetical protein
VLKEGWVRGGLTRCEESERFLFHWLEAVTAIARTLERVLVDCGTGSRGEGAEKAASAQAGRWWAGGGRIMRVGECNEVRAPGTPRLSDRLVGRASNNDAAG